MPEGRVVIGGIEDEAMSLVVRMAKESCSCCDEEGVVERLSVLTSWMAVGAVVTER